MQNPIVKRLLDAHAACEDDDQTAQILLNTTVVLDDTSHKPKKRRGGSRRGKHPNLERDHASGHASIARDCFQENAVFPEKKFRRRYRMSRRLFDRVLQGVVATEPYFEQRRDATGKLGLSSLQKVTTALRILCYGISSDATDEYVRIGESTAMESLKRFADAVVNCFGAEYLREPTAEDSERQTAINARRGFPGMFGSLDCTHWNWKNCAVGLHGQYRDKDGNCSIILEAVASYSLWIWHSYVGVPGSNNDINVVDRSPLIVNWLQGKAPSHKSTINGKRYESCYLLCDSIYPNWAVFVKTISQPQNEKERYFAKKQEALRKDVERCFGVSKGRFALLSQPARYWGQATLNRIWYASIALHNMIVEDEEDEDDDQAEEQEEDDQESVAGRAYFERATVVSTAHESMHFDMFLTQLSAVQDSTKHAALQNDLVEHLWARKRAKHQI